GAGRVSWNDLMLRVAFVSLELGTLAGVTNALHGQARAAKREGLPLDFIVANRDLEGVEGDVRFARCSFGRGHRRMAPLFKSRLIASLPQLSDYEVILLRYPFSVDLD